MADAVHLGQIADGASAGTAGHRTHHHAHASQAPASFQQALLRAVGSKVATGRFTSAIHHAAARVPAVAAAKPGNTAPGASVTALSEAMAREGVPTSWQPGLTYIMAQESSGKVDAQSPVHSARGLYQLTAANYHYNPHGTASFGNAVEEAQGGIRYIRARYGTADNAVAFWQQHRWYEGRPSGRRGGSHSGCRGGSQAVAVALGEPEFDWRRRPISAYAARGPRPAACGHWPGIHARTPGVRERHVVPSATAAPLSCWALIGRYRPWALAGRLKPTGCDQRSRPAGRDQRPRPEIGTSGLYRWHSRRPVVFPAPADDLEPTQIRSSEVHGQLSVRLCDEGPDQGLSRRTGGVQGHHPLLPARREDRRAGRERRRQIDAAEDHGRHRDGISAARPGRPRARASATWRRNRSSIPAKTVGENVRGGVRRAEGGARPVQRDLHASSPSR